MASLAGRRIVQIAGFYGAHGGSFVDAMSALSQAVVARGGTFEIIVPPVTGATWHERIHAAGGTVSTVRPGIAALRTLLARRPHVVHAHFYGYVEPAALAAVTHRARFIWHLHSSTPVPGRLGRVKEALRWRVVRAAGARLVAVSGGLAEELRGRGAPRAIAVVRNGIDLGRFRPPSGDERRLARERFGIGPERRVVLFFGRDRFVKGGDTLRDALRDAASTTLLGIAMPDDLVRDIRSAVDTVAVERLDDVRWAHWAADVVASPSRLEAAGLALMEGLACGVAAVASDIPALRETAAGSARCTFVPVGDATALRAALDAAPPPGELEPAVRMRYGLETWVDRLLALYGDAGGADGRAA